MGSALKALILIPLLALAMTISSHAKGQAPLLSRAKGLWMAQSTEPRSAADQREHARRANQFVCNVSLFFSTDITDRIAVDRKKKLEGRGLLTCQNDQGFTTEHGIVAEMTAELPPKTKPNAEFAFSGNTSPFIVPREIGQIQDSYTVKSVLPTSRTPASKPMALLRGHTHDLVIEMDFNSRESDLTLLRVIDLNFRFDDSAPDLF